jgi:hypothetical protein
VTEVGKRPRTQAEKDIGELLLTSGTVVASIGATPAVPLPPHMAKRMGGAMGNVQRREKESAARAAEAKSAFVGSPLKWRPAKKGSIPEPITNTFMFE